MYFTDRGIEELDDRRGDEQVSISWLAGRLRDFVDEHPDAESTIDGLASWLARFDDDEVLAAFDPGQPAGRLATAASEPALAGPDADEDPEVPA
jgi:Family of unknown function (DUF6104)